MHNIGSFAYRCCTAALLILYSYYSTTTYCSCTRDLKAGSAVCVSAVICAGCRVAGASRAKAFAPAVSQGRYDRQSAMITSIFAYVALFWDVDWLAARLFFVRS